MRKVWTLGTNGVGFGIHVLGFGTGDGTASADCEDVVAEKALSPWTAVETPTGAAAAGRSRSPKAEWSRSEFMCAVERIRRPDWLVHSTRKVL